MEPLILARQQASSEYTQISNSPSMEKLKAATNGLRALMISARAGRWAYAYVPEGRGVAIPCAIDTPI